MSDTSPLDIVAPGFPEQEGPSDKPILGPEELPFRADALYEWLDSPEAERLKAYAEPLERLIELVEHQPAIGREQ